jgi:hypothetical protein
MNEPEPSKFEQTRQSFVKIIRHKTDMEEKIMALIKHPDATGSQIMEARQALLGVDEPLRRVVTALREKYPYPTISVITRPWHRQEYDRYDEAIMGTFRPDSRESEGNNQTNQEARDGV